MRSGRETRSLAAKRGKKRSRMNTRFAMNRVALPNDLIGDDYSATVEMMDSEDTLQGV